jgi:hypothetical protein
MLLYAAVVPVQGLFLLDHAARDRFIGEFVRMGVPEEGRRIINALLKGDPVEAKAVLQQWRSMPPATISAYERVSANDFAMVSNADEAELAEAV